MDCQPGAARHSGTTRARAVCGCPPADKVAADEIGRVECEPTFREDRSHPVLSLRVRSHRHRLDYLPGRRDAVFRTPPTDLVVSADEHLSHAGALHVCAIDLCALPR